MKQGLIKLYNDKKLTDFTISCGPHTFEVHKAVVCSQSEYFAALPKFAEGATNKIELKAIGSDGSDDSCDDPEAIKLMVHFFYHHDYRAKNVFDAPSAASVLAQPPRHVTKKNSTKQSAAQPDTDGNMVMHARVFAAACKYRVPALETAAASKYVHPAGLRTQGSLFETAVSANWDHQSFAEAALVVYSTTPEDVTTLRTIVVSTIHARSALLAKAEVKDFVKSERDLMYTLLCKNYGVLASRSQEVQAEEVPTAAAVCSCGRDFYQYCNYCGAVWWPCCRGGCVCENARF